MGMRVEMAFDSHAQRDRLDKLDSQFASAERCIQQMNAQVSLLRRDTDALRIDVQGVLAATHRKVSIPNSGHETAVACGTDKASNDFVTSRPSNDNQDHNDSSKGVSLALATILAKVGEVDHGEVRAACQAFLTPLVGSEGELIDSLAVGVHSDKCQHPH